MVLSRTRVLSGDTTYGETKVKVFLVICDSNTERYIGRMPKEIQQQSIQDVAARG